MSTTTYNPFSTPPFIQLAHRLRLTNARYNLIAYQCRSTRRPTHHAKRRAYRVGLRIDTSKARAAWSDVSVTGATEVTVSEDRPARASGETVDRSYWSPEDPDDAFPHPAPEHVAATELSPLGLGLSGLDDVKVPCYCSGPVPGAPRWRLKPLPKDEYVHDARSGVVNGTISFDLNPVLQRVINARHVWVQVDGEPLARHLKRKRQDLESDQGAEVYHQGCSFGARWSNAYEL